MSEMKAYGPHPAAVAHAVKRLLPPSSTWLLDEKIKTQAQQVADALHDPALGSDRSVCLRDVDALLFGLITGPHGNLSAATIQRVRMLIEAAFCAR